MSNRTSPAVLPGSKYEGLLARFYDADHAWRDYRRQSRFLASLLPKSVAGPGIRVLDVCCGTGSHALCLARQGLRVTGIDISRAFIRMAREKAGQKGSPVRFVLGDIFKMEGISGFRGCFDAAFLLGWSLSMAPLCDRLGELLSAVEKILKPGGLFVLDVPMGLNVNKVTDLPLRYSLSPQLSGSLRIGQRINVKKRLRAFRYDWVVKRVRNGRVIEESFAAEERLRILEPRSFLKRLERQAGKFVLEAAYRDYDSGSPFRNGDGNLVAVLKKCTA